MPGDVEEEGPGGGVVGVGHVVDAEEGECVVWMGRGEVERVEGAQEQGLLGGEAGLDECCAVGKGVDGAQRGAEQERARCGAGAVCANEEGARGGCGVGEVRGDGLAVGRVGDVVQAFVVLDGEILGEQVAQFAAAQTVEGAECYGCETLACVAFEPDEVVEVLCGHVRVDLEGLDLGVELTVWKQTSKHRSAPMETHIPVSFSMVVGVLLEDSAWDAGLVGSAYVGGGVEGESHSRDQCVKRPV